MLKVQIVPLKGEPFSDFEADTCKQTDNLINFCSVIDGEIHELVFNTNALLSVHIHHMKDEEESESEGP